MMGQSVPQMRDGKVVGAGFEIAIPAGVRVTIGATPESEHGFFLELPPDADDRHAATTHTPYRYIAFDTKWDVGDMPSLQAVVDSITSHILDYIPADLVADGELSLDGNIGTRLSTIPARRLVVKYKNTAKQHAVRQILIAYNARKDADAVVYTFILNTTEENFQEDVSLFSKLLAGFKLTNQ